jgi:GT2 family glycosyltransferase
MKNLAVIIPAFNSADTIVETLESLQRQSDLSAVCAVYLADDASTDGTVAAAQAVWRSVVPFVVLRSEINQGERSTVNRAVARLPSGVEWFLILHADDIAKPEWVDVLAKETAVAPHDVISLTASYDVLDEAGRITPGENFGIERKVLVEGNTESIRSTLCRGCWFKVSSCAIRVEAFRSLGGFRCDMPQLGDWDFVLRALEAGWVIEYLPLCLSVYRQHPGSVSSKSFREHRDVTEALWVLDRFSRYLPGRDLLRRHLFYLKSLMRRSARSILMGDGKRLYRAVSLSFGVAASFVRLEFRRLNSE